jgi:aryl-alcohol dehydrogenase-like predicted oxidoreductase
VGATPVSDDKARRGARDAERLNAIADHRVRVVSNQVQYSIVDRRPEDRMARFCSDHPVTLLAYGTLLGRLLLGDENP